MPPEGAATITFEERLATEVEQILHKRIADNQLSLPPPPTAVTKVMALLRENNFSPKDAAPLIEKDTVLAARILKSANSVAHAGMERAKSLPQSLTRLGVERLKSVLIEASASRLFESRDARIAEACKGLWEHSLAVAILSRDVAALAGVQEAEVAYLSGLLHDIGKPVVAWLLLEAEKTVVGTRTNFWIDQNTWIEVVQRVHRPVGKALAAKWNLPEAVTKAINDCNDYDGSERLCVANCVRFANALAKREQIYVGKVDHSDVDALVMVGRSLLGVDDTVLNRLVSGLPDRVKNMLS